MLSHVLRTIARHGLLADPQARSVLCAVSGGPDSMAMLACLWELGPRLGLHLEVATVDHGLRPGVAAEIALVAERAAALSLPFHRIGVDVAGARRQAATGTGTGAGRGGVQEVARRLRLAALMDLADARGLGRVALGHNADDQTETVLFRIIRGTGIKGLSGIPYARDRFVRPLLDVTRSQILAYLARRSLPFATDPSNADLRHARARLRHRILPFLRQENPRVDRALRTLAVEAAERQSPASGMSDVLGSGVHIPGRVLAEIRAAAREGKGTRSFDVSGGRRVTVSYGRVDVGCADSPRSPGPGELPATGQTELPAFVTMPGPGTYVFAPGARILVREQPAGPCGVEPAPGTEPAAGWAWFDGAELSWPLLARRRRPGDRMRPRGGAGSRKVSDLLIDAKIPRRVRALLPVITTAAGDPLLVPGLRPARTATPSRLTTRMIGLAVVRNTDHDALVDHSIVRGNTGRDSDRRRLPLEPDTGGCREPETGEWTNGCAGGTRRVDGRAR